MESNDFSYRLNFDAQISYVKDIVTNQKHNMDVHCT